MVASSLRAVVLGLFLGSWAAFAAAAEPANNSASGTHILRGVVKDAQGNPVAGAKVWAISGHHVIGLNEYDQSETDAEGRFELSIDGRWQQGAPRYWHELSLVAYSHQHGIGGLSFNRDSRLPGEPLEIALSAKATTPVQVLDPDRKPVAGATVQPAMLKCDLVYTTLSQSQARQMAKQYSNEPRQTPWGTVAGWAVVSLPAELSQQLAHRTDAEGRATIDVSQDGVYSIAVEAESFGTQHFDRVNVAAAEGNPMETVKLHPLVDVTGKIEGPKDDVAGKKIALWGFPSPPVGAKSYAKIYATLTTDDAGEFRTRMPAGQLTAYLDWDVKSAVRPVPPDQFVVNKGGKNHFEIRLVEAVKVHGYVRDTANKQGVPGIRLYSIVGYGTSEALVTDDQGRYEVMAAPGRAVVVPELSADWIPAAKGTTLVQQAAAGTGQELAPILVKRAVTLEGIVVDDSGKPVPDAVVSATWYGYSRVLQRDDLNSEQATTDAEGKFEIRGIDPASECRVVAERGGACTEKVTVLKGQGKPLELKISDRHGVALTGRIVDAAGKPVAKAKLQLWRQPWGPEFYEVVTERVVLAEGDDWLTDEQGQFATHRLPPDGKYRVSLVDPQYQPSHTPWIDVASGKSQALDDLLARKLGEHSGTVVDSGGNPIAGAKLAFQGGGKRVESVSDEQGRFRLSPAPDGPGMLFASKPGYRFHGRRMTTFGQALSIKLAQLDEPYGEKLEVKPPAVPRQRRRELARKLADEIIKQGGLDLTGQNRSQVLSELAKADPHAALDHLEKKRFLIPMQNDAVRFQAARTLMAESPEEALELIEDLTSIPHMQSMTYVDIAASLPPEKRNRRMELLAEALVKAQGIKEPGFRLASIAKVAEGLLDAGEKERGKKLLKEHAESAQKLNKAGYDAFLRGMYAEELAQVDLEPALALVNEINEYSERVRHLGNIAHELAAIDPEAAERVLKSIQPPAADSRLIYTADSDAVKVCYRMAKVDLPRARAIASACVDPFHKAHAHGTIAVAITERDAAQAAELIRAAFDVLDEAAHSGRELPLSAGDFGNVGGWLVWQAQQIDPELGAESLWRLQALLPEVPTTDPQRSWRDTAGLTSAAMFVALVDPAPARELLGRLDGSQTAEHGRGWMTAWSLVDPEKGAEKALAATRGPQAIAAIAAEGEQRLKTVHYYAGLWRIDVEDIDH